MYPNLEILKFKKKSGRILAIEHLIKHLILALLIYIYIHFSLYIASQKKKKKGAATHVAKTESE
jgi:hypothetical protein